MLAHVPSFGRNPRGSPGFLAYPVPKACMHVLGTRVPRCLGVARSASSPKAAQALGCNLTPGLRISFGRVTCMARAASVPGLWTLGFVLLRGACVSVWVVVGFWFRLRPATPGLGVGACVCLCARFVCTPPLLAGVCGVAVCVWARVSATPRHSWLGCWGVCVLWACSARTPPLLAGVCGVSVCAWARVLAAPRHSWLGCRGLCVLVCALRLHPATPGWGVRRGCVCLASGFGYALPLLAGVLGCVCGLGLFRLYPPTPGWGVRCECVCFGSGFGCAPPLLAAVSGIVCSCVRAPLAPRHSWLGCAAWVCVFGLVFRLRPATPGWVGGLCVCWCACSPCTPPLLAGVYGVGVSIWAGVSAVPLQSWLGCGCVCVLLCALCLHPATPGWGVRCGCGCLGSGFGCALPLLAGVCGVGVCVWAPVSAAPRHSWLGWWGVCVLVCVLPLYPAAPGWGVRCGSGCLGSGFGCAPPLLAGVLGCACLCASSPCSLPLLAGVCGVVVCARARVLVAPRHSWLGCSGVCVLLCALCLWHATPGWGVRCGCVCLGSGFSCAPPLLAGVLGCACLFACSPCTLPLLAGVCGVGVRALARVSAAPRHSWLGCWGVRVCVRAPLVPRHSWLRCAAWVCVLGLGFPLRPATPGRGVGVFVFVCIPPLFPATPGWGVRRGCVCSGSGFGCAPALLAGVLGCVRACVPVPLVPRHSWLGCAAWVCVLGLGFRLRPATPGWGVGLCVCWCARSACTPPLLAAVCGVGVCAWARVSAAARHSWLGCWGVRVCVRAPLVPRHSWLGCAAWVCALGLGFWLCPATRGWGVGVCVCWCARSACTPPFLAGVCGVGVCA